MDIDLIDLPPKTINITWSDGGSNLDDRYIKESPTIASQTTIAFSEKTSPSSFELLFDLLKKCPAWGFFSVPNNYYKASNRFFTYNLLPWLKIEQTIKLFEEKALEQKLNLSSSPDAKIIYNLLNTLDDLSKMIEEALSKILQYRKG